jgi:nondiscriminating glutamyl-tRNA synthetase
MDISHVIRGAEHLSNTVRQILVYEALEKPGPAFAHIPLILGSDRAKLSKRHGAPNIRDYRLKGYPAEGLVNYLVFLGWSTRKESEILSKDDLIGEFELGRVSDSPSIFDEAKLNWISAQHIRSGGAKKYFNAALPFFPRELKDAYCGEMLERIFDIASENLPSFSRLEGETAPFRPGTPGLGENEIDMIDHSRALLGELKARFSEAEHWDRETIKALIGGAGNKLGLKGKNLYMPLRVAVTGDRRGCDLTSILEIRGRDDIVGSIGGALEKAASGGK